MEQPAWGLNPTQRPLSLEHLQPLDLRQKLILVHLQPLLSRTDKTNAALPWSRAASDSRKMSGHAGPARAGVTGSLGSCHMLIQQIKPLIKGKRLPWWKAKQGSLIITTILSAYRGDSALDLNLSYDALIPSCNGTLVFWTLTESLPKPVAGSGSQ